MTREDREMAIEYFEFHRKIFCDDHLKDCPKDSIAYQATLKEKSFYDMAIKALEQEPILDKVRTEIEQITDTMGVSYNQYVSKIDVLQIIDKYKAERKSL